MSRLVTIAIKPDLHEWLKSRGRKGETFDELLRRLLEFPKEGLCDEGDKHKR